MNLRLRIILGFSILVGLGFYFLTDWLMDDLRPRYLEAVEETLVDQAYLLSGLVHVDPYSQAIDTQSFDNAFKSLTNKRVEAKIYGLLKTDFDTRVYLIDRMGKVLFDSTGKNTGGDFSAWRDFILTMRGQYGARTTRDDRQDPTSSVLYVSAPIHDSQGAVAGVVTVGKPTQGINLFIQSARPQIQIAVLIAALAILLLGALLTFLITRPIEKLIRYTQDVREGKHAELPSLGSNEWERIAVAIKEMKAALDGKQYVENYVQALTHELKSPLAGIKGAAEIVEEEVKDPTSKKFLGNILNECSRIEDLANRLLELSSLENRPAIEKQNVSTQSLTQEAVQVLKGMAVAKKVDLKMEAEDADVLLDPFLAKQALLNLIKNAIEFTPAEGHVVVTGRKTDSSYEWTVADTGTGIPDYGFARIFEKFYSLPRPDTQRKSTGLGLAFVKEVAELHGGSIHLSNQPHGGLTAVFSLPS